MPCIVDAECWQRYMERIIRRSAASHYLKISSGCSYLNDMLCFAVENGSDSWRESTIIREQKYVEVCRKSDSMLKLMGGFFTILAGSLLGGCLAWEQDRICQEMRYLQGLMLRLRGELWYSRTMLPDIFRRLAGEMKEPYGRWLSEMADRMCRKDGGNLVEIWSQEVGTHLKENMIPEEERQRLMELGGFLGHADIDMQIRYLDRYLEELADAIKKRQSMLGEKKKLYRSLGMIGGILIAVMLI